MDGGIDELIDVVLRTVHYIVLLIHILYFLPWDFHDVPDVTLIYNYPPGF